jgi:hypothetical protein
MSSGIDVIGCCSAACSVAANLLDGAVAKTPLIGVCWCGQTFRREGRTINKKYCCEAHRQAAFQRLYRIHHGHSYRQARVTKNRMRWRPVKTLAKTTIILLMSLGSVTLAQRGIF